jgi:integrase
MAKRKRGNNEGSIYRLKDGRWCAALSIGYRDGKQLRKFYVAKTRSEVQDKLAKALRDRQMGLPIPGERETLGAFLKHWLEHVAANNVRPSTLESYSWIVNRHLTPNLGRIPLAKLTPQDIQLFLNDRLKCGRQPLPRRKCKTDGPPKLPANPALTPRTVQHIHATLRAALEQALRWNLVARNVATLVDAPRVRRPEVEPYTPEEAKKLLNALKDDRLAALYSAAMAVGLRQGEALGLRWSDIDFEARTLSVRNALQRVNGKLQLVEVKTQKSRRTITLPQVVMNALVKHQMRQAQERQEAGSRWVEGGFVFTTTIGTPLDGSTVTHRFQAAVKAAGLRRLRFHDLRHTCATLLLAQGVHPRVIMEVLGHSQIGITMNLYSHVLPAMQKEIANSMDAILTPAPQPVADTVADKAAPGVIN